MTIRTLTAEETLYVGGGRGTGGRAVRGCFNGAMAGAGVAPSGYRMQAAGAGCLAGASVGMLGGGAEAQSAAGMAAGLAFGDRNSRYGGSSRDPSAPNYENEMDRADHRRQ